MSIQINTTGRRVNRYSDFKLVMSLTKNGAAYVPQAFMMVFYVDSWDDCQGRYTASCINGELTHCEIDGTTISVFFDAPGLNLGQLKCRVLDMVDDTSFTDGTLDTCTPIALPVEIVAGAGDADTIVLGYGDAYFGNNHDLVLEGSASPSFGENNNLEI
jgi:hypothetical protein